jgi:uncharacterized protein YbjT (DUF2867 family)
MLVVTAPAGQIGQHVVRHLLEADQSARLIVRDRSKLPRQTGERFEIVEGSPGDPAVLDRALEGADALFWLAPPDPRATLDEAYVEFTRPAADAIRRHGVRHVVSVTTLGRGTEWQDKAGLVIASIAMDDLLMSTGVAFRGLAMPSFMENVARQAGVMKERGAFFGPIDPDKRLPTTATLDMGAVAAEFLIDRSWMGQEEVPVLGPEDLSNNEMAAIISNVLGREVRYQQISYEAFKQQFVSRGMSQAFAQGYVDMYRSKDQGMDNVAELDANCRTPTSFRQWAEDTLKPAILN